MRGKVSALRREREGLSAAISAIRDAGIARVRQVADAATGEVGRATARFEQLSADAAALQEDVTFARALRGGAPALWHPVEPQVGEVMLVRLEQWSEANLATPEVPIPDEVRKQAKGIHEYSAAYGSRRGSRSKA